MKRHIQLLQQLKNTPTETIRALLFWLFGLAVLLFPLGQALRTIGPLLCLPFLCWLYYRDWEHCTLRRLPLRWIFALLFGAVLLQLLFSIDRATSLSVVSPNFTRAFILPFIAMECVRNEKDLRRLVLILVATMVYEGLDGVWQGLTGKDFIKGAQPVAGRLTGSFGGYRVGDYMGISLVGAMALTELLPLRSTLWRWAASIALLSPAFYLLFFAQARIGFLGFLFGLYLVVVCANNRINWKTILLPLGMLLLLLAFGPKRISFELMMQDDRIKLWTAAFKTILHSPIFGTGAGTFEPALVAAGLDPATITGDGAGFMHPHNAYLQFLVDGGLLGFSLVMAFIGSVTLWSFFQIWRGVKLEKQEIVQGSHWRISAFFWGAWMAYLVVLLAGHDFYRTWFLACGMTMLGIMLGACATGPQASKGST